MTKNDILKLIRNPAAGEGGDVGLRRFIALSGVKEKQIIGAHWPTWNDAKREAGLQTAAFMRPRLAEESVLPAFATLLAQLGKWPTESALRLAKRRDGQIPSVKVSRRLENDPEFMEKLRDYCKARPQFASVVSLITQRSRNIYQASSITPVSVVGYVYMMRSGRRYKIGHTSSPSRRHREVRLDLPQRTDLVHSIETDDPNGIEAYWHNRFAGQRVRDTEFFELSATDVAAFKRRKFQ